MNWNSLQNTLRFSRSERWGLFFLLALLFGLYGLGGRFPGRPLPSSAPVPETIEKEQKRTGLLKNANIQLKINRFDPNRTSAADWIELGLRPRTARTIENYLAKGGRFYRKEDLKKIWGLLPSEYERLAPFLQIGEGRKRSMSYPERSSVYRDNRNKNDGGSPFGKRGKLDLNRSDSADWEALPGIGPGYARRITRYREKLGGFVRVEQVGETYQLPDSVFQRIVPYLTDSGEAWVRQLDLNAVTVDTLGRHPYCGFTKARLIIRYREQHGPFGSVDDLLNIQVLDDRWLTRIRPYLLVK